MSVVEVLNPGALTTVQDLGRFGFAHLGISPAGGADSLSLRIANRIVGNDESAAVLEMTLVGSKLQFHGACTIALVGATTAGSSVPMFEAVRVEAGFVLECGPLQHGARTYLAIAGGIDVTPVLGSASTHLAGGFGGYQGRALKRGDVIDLGAGVRPTKHADPANLRNLVRPRRTVRITKGPQYHLFDQNEIEALCASEYVVTEQSNRLGLRLAGTTLRALVPGELLTEGVSLGAIQVPPSGQPIVLFVDQQTTGGYPKLANVIAADIHSIGQLRPRDTVRFELVTIGNAIQALREQERTLAEAFTA